MSGPASARERASFARLMERYEGGQADLVAGEAAPGEGSGRYGQEYLLHSYYFDL
ncbi:MAG: hypothetical protein V8S24_16200 [Gordonibacter pamelaeae]